MHTFIRITPTPSFNIFRMQSYHIFTFAYFYLSCEFFIFSIILLIDHRCRYKQKTTTLWWHFNKYNIVYNKVYLSVSGKCIFTSVSWRCDSLRLGIQMRIPRKTIFSSGHVDAMARHLIVYIQTLCEWILISESQIFSAHLLLNSFYFVCCRQRKWLRWRPVASSLVSQSQPSLRLQLCLLYIRNSFKW